MISKIKFLVLILATALLVSCGGKEKSDVKPASSVKEYHLTANDQMKFNLNAMVAEAGQKVKIVFENIGKMPKETMGHNFVLLKPDVDVAAFAAEAVNSKDNEYIPANSNDIIFHSKLLGPGEKVILEFNAPQKGTYKFICSFPGHYITMQGNFVVK
ncbi:MAG: azurin [Ignavibacteriae bacterium]|nr:MAG: azurin [Ignavibacteriota bacterium]